MLCLIVAPLYLITKLQNLKAIHNCLVDVDFCDIVVSNYKITKSESYSQQSVGILPLISVVSNYKITKSESYSQPLADNKTYKVSCI